MRARTFATVTVLLIAASPACATPRVRAHPKAAAPSATPPQRPVDVEEDWIAEAEKKSREHLQDMCVDAIPLDAFDRHGKALRRCNARVARAVDEEWTAITDAAVERCAADDGTHGCCLERFVPGDEFEKRIRDCTADCAVRLGHAVPRNVAGCVSKDVSPPADALARFITPAAAAILDQCEASYAAQGKCDSLPTWIERTVCHANCDQLERIREYHKRLRAAFEACVERGTTRDVRCDIHEEPPAGAHTKADCEAACKDYLLTHHKP